MTKKHWIYIKRGLSEDPKHRETMGNRIWLFMHIIDRADWETGIVYEWRDHDEAQDMGLPWRTLQKQRQELEELGYIFCEKKQHGQNITICNWLNPRDYSGKVMNKRSSTQKSVLSDENDESTQNSVPSNFESTPQSTQRSYADLGTPTSNSKINDHMKWMDEDPICQFLFKLPGFNPATVESTRREIVSHAYPLDELPYLWNECALADNPIGLFTHKVTTGQRSVDWQLLQMQQRNEAARLAGLQDDAQRAQGQLQRRAATAPTGKPLQADSSVTDAHRATWNELLDELRIDIQPQTFSVYIAPAQPISVNGSWTIAVPAVEWWQGHLATSLPRIYRKLTGQETTFTFVKAGGQ